MQTIIIIISTVIAACAGFEGIAMKTGLNIPGNIISCYENQTLYNRASRLPSTINSLISLIAKVEKAGGMNMDMRSLTAALLHQFRLDGIQRAPEIPWNSGVVPFTPSGRQHPKFRVLKENLIPSGNILPDEGLLDFEKCSLHFLLSSTVSPWERGDEFEICPMQIGGRNIDVSSTSNLKKPPLRSWSEWPGEDGEDSTPPKASVSRCPIEDGALWTPWGNVNAGTVLASIAAALQPQRVPLSMLIDGINSGEEHSEALDNKWAAALAGDLAEVAVYQGPRAQSYEHLRLGPGGRWNDTAMPRAFYMDPWIGPQNGWEQESWDLTESELRGGLDGIIIAENLPRWMDLHGRLRLSQVLDMYYSDRGVSFDNEIKACRRNDLAKQYVPLEKLKEQTQSFATVLYNHVDAVPMASSTLAKFADNAVKAGVIFADNVMKRDSELFSCNEVPYPVPYLEALVVLDGSWTSWEAQRVIGTLEKEIDVSEHGSLISVMNGYSGEMMVNFTRLSNFASYKMQNSSAWPVGLNLENTIRGAKKYLLRRRALHARRGENVASASRGTVIIILAPTATMSQNVIYQSKDEHRLFKPLLPDIKFLVVTSRGKQELSFLADDPENDILQVSSSEMSVFMPQLLERLRNVPARILPAMCPSLVQDAFLGQAIKEWQQVEPKGPISDGYVTFGEPLIYRIPKEQLVGTNKVSITFKSSNYGDLVVCISRKPPLIEREGLPMETQPGTEPRTIEDDVQERCEPLKAEQEHTFRISQPCPYEVSSCKPIYFLLKVAASDTICFEKDCRYPNQVRFSMWHYGLKPLPGCAWDTGSSNKAVPMMNALTLLCFILFIYLL